MTCTSGWFWSEKGRRSPGSGSGGCHRCCSLGRRSIAPASGRRRRWRGPKTSRGQACQGPPQLRLDATQANTALPHASSGQRKALGCLMTSASLRRGFLPPLRAPDCGTLLRLFPFRQGCTDRSKAPEVPTARQVRAVKLLGKHHEAHAPRCVEHPRAAALHWRSTAPR